MGFPAPLQAWQSPRPLQPLAPQLRCLPGVVPTALYLFSPQGVPCSLWAQRGVTSHHRGP